MFLDRNRLPQVLASRCKISCEVSFSTCSQTYNFAIFTLPWTDYTLNFVYFLMVYRLYTKTLSFLLNLRVNETHLCKRPDRVVYNAFEQHRCYAPSCVQCSANDVPLIVQEAGSLNPEQSYFCGIDFYEPDRVILILGNPILGNPRCFVESGPEAQAMSPGGAGSYQRTLLD